MPFGRRLPRTGIDAKMTVRQRSMLDTVEKLTRIQGGMGVVWASGSPMITQPRTPFRFGLTGPGGISPATPIKPKTTLTDEVPGVPGIATDLITVTVTRSDTNTGEMKSWPDDKFTAVNPYVSAVPPNTTIAFFLINDLWIPASSSPPGRLAIITGSGITARVGKKVGSGSVSVQDIDDHDMIVDANPVLNLTAKNYSTTAFAAAKYCWVEQNEQGRWIVVSVEC